MSDPVTNVQIEDVLSSIRRLVSEEIGQQEPLRKREIVDKDEDEKLVLSPAQKVRQEAAADGGDLWEETEELAPKEAAPVWWHRDMSEMTSLEADDLTVEDAVEPEAQPKAATAAQEDIQPEQDELTAEPEVTAPLEGALAGLQAAKSMHDDAWEPPEGEADMDGGPEFEAMPWHGDEEAEVYGAEQDEVEAVETAEAEPEPAEPEATEEDVPFTFRPGERLFERLSSKKMSASPLPEIETVEAAVAETALEDPVEVEEDFEAISDLSVEDDFDEPLDASVDDGDLSNIFDEDMLREMVKDIIRQELQGVLGERITRNVRKLVRREIQRALSDLNT